MKSIVIKELIKDIPELSFEESVALKVGKCPWRNPEAV